MKLRIKDDSLRLRLSQTEIAAISAGENVASPTRFGDDAALNVGIVLDPSAIAPQASVQPFAVTVTLPTAAAQSWAQSDEVSLRGEQPFASGSMSILIEKDFQCLAPRDEDESDLFPNPDACGH